MITTGSRLLVSACLLGLKCNYKGQASSAWQERPDFWQQIARKFQIVPVCPEQLGGLPTPRIPAELQGSAMQVVAGNSRVINRSGIDVTACFVKGAEETLFLARSVEIDLAIMKTRSPSCGKYQIYDGTFSGCLISGAGITVNQLLAGGYEVMDELEFYEFVSQSGLMS